MKTGPCRPNRSNNSAGRRSPYAVIIRSKTLIKSLPRARSPTLLRILLRSGFWTKNRVKPERYESQVCFAAMTWTDGSNWFSSGSSIEFRRRTQPATLRHSMLGIRRPEADGRDNMLRSPLSFGISNAVLRTKSSGKS